VVFLLSRGGVLDVRGGAEDSVEVTGGVNNRLEEEGKNKKEEGWWWWRRERTVPRAGWNHHNVIMNVIGLFSVPGCGQPHVRRGDFLLSGTERVSCGRRGFLNRVRGISCVTAPV
jgi:hypothetical protein